MVETILIAGQSNAEGLRENLAHELEMRGVSINVMEGNVGGSTVIRRITPDDGVCWFRENSVIPPLLEQLAKIELVAVWWVQGESEALWGPVAADEYSHALEKLRELFGNPSIFMVSPIAAPHDLYPHSRAVLAAQYRSPERGFVLGPEYFDLEHNQEHLTATGREIFAARAADILEPLLKGRK